MIHSSYYKIKVIPIFNDVGPDEIDRLQDFSVTTTLNREKIEEISRVGLVDWRNIEPTSSGSLTQLEYGSIDFWRRLANKGNSVTTISYTDFKTSAVDIVGFKTDDNGTFLGTVWYPMLRLGGCGISIGDPEALIERSFSLVGENEITFLNDTKYLIHKRVAVAAGTDSTVTLSSPSPAVDPDNSSQYILRVIRLRDGVGTELYFGTDWSYDGAGTLTINGISSTGDIVKTWYASATDPNSESNFTLNDADAAGITADSADIFLVTSSRVTRLQSVSVDTSFDRNDIKEIGKKGVVQRSVNDINHTITLGRILEDYTIEEILRGKAGLNYDKIDLQKLQNNANLIIKVYSDSTKDTFKLGYKFLSCAPSSIDSALGVNAYENRNTSLTCEEGFITSVEAVL